MIKKIIPLTLLLLLLSGCSFAIISEDNVDLYEKELKAAIADVDLHSELYIFPESTKQGIPLKFSSLSRMALFTNDYFFYLVMKYDEETFDSELTRLEEIKANFKSGNTKSILKDETYPLFITIYDTYRFEYAVYDKEKFEIAYVTNQLFDWEETNIEVYHIVPELNFHSIGSYPKNGYNMYYHYVDNVGEYVKD